MDIGVVGYAHIVNLICAQEPIPADISIDLQGDVVSGSVAPAGSKQSIKLSVSLERNDNRTVCVAMCECSATSLTVVSDGDVIQVSVEIENTVIPGLAVVARMAAKGVHSKVASKRVICRQCSNDCCGISRYPIHSVVKDLLASLGDGPANIDRRGEKGDVLA